MGEEIILGEEIIPLCEANEIRPAISGVAIHQPGSANTYNVVPWRR